jgi:Ca-activated chloride channel homolog
MKNILLTVLCSLMLTGVFAQKENRYVREGNRNFRKGDYSAAEKDYRKALELNQESVKGQFNLGATVYQEKNYDESAKIYGGLGEKPLPKPIKAGAYHNLGNAMLEAQQYEKSIEAYKKALIENPNDMDSKYNLAYARQKLEQQQQQQDQQNQDQDKDQQEKQKQPQDQKDQEEQKDQQDQQQPQQNQQPDQQQQKQPPRPNKMSKEDAERMLEAMKNDEKKTMEKVKKQKAKVVVGSIEKDW